MVRPVAAPEITPRLRVPSSPKSTVTSVIGCSGVNAGVTMNEMGTPTEPVEADAVMATVGLTRVRTNEKAAVPRCGFKSIADATMVHDTATTAATTIKAAVEVGTAPLPEGSEPSDGAKDEGGWNVTVKDLTKIIE